MVYDQTDRLHDSYSDNLPTIHAEGTRTLKIRTPLAFACLLLGSLGVTQTASAQDVFQTGQTARDYNYLQATYLINRGEYSLPLILEGQISINSNFTLVAQYLDLSENQTFKIENVDFDVKLKAVNMRAGIGYHVASKRWSQVDWLAGLFVGRFTTSAVATAETGDVIVVKLKNNSVVARIGVRASITPSLETQATVSTAYSDSELGDEQLNFLAVYRVTTHLDVALGAIDVSDDPNYNLGLRYSW